MVTSLKLRIGSLQSTRSAQVAPVRSTLAVDSENNEFKAIVFEFMANGSLDMWVHPKLHQNSPKGGLSLSQRIRIAMDVSSALDYMHNQLTPPLIHCDMTARVGDFGSAKFLSSSLGCPEGLVGVGGTIEYGMGCNISTGCDVYSFGVLLLEMLTGKRPTDAMFSDGLSLHHACAAVLMQSYVSPLVEVGLLCSMESPKDRPGMREVCAKIFAINESFLQSW